MKKSLVGRFAALALAVLISCSIAYAWNEAEFTSRPLYAYPLPHGHDDIVGNLTQDGAVHPPRRVTPRAQVTAEHVAAVVELHAVR